MKTYFPNPDDILNFKLTIDPDEGMYKGGRFDFDFKINQNFPHDPPKVKCTQKIYHPNIDLEGNVCLNILREDWKPVLNLNAVVVGLQVCFRRLWGPLSMLTDTVSLPRAERVGSAEQGGCGGLEAEPRRLQAQRAVVAWWWGCKGPEL
jgi:ubiquitin-protein ligase